MNEIVTTHGEAQKHSDGRGRHPQADSTPDDSTRHSSPDEENAFANVSSWQSVGCQRHFRNWNSLEVG
jgi:hypothetical protein